MTDETLREKLIRLVTKLVNADFEGSEEEADALLGQIEALVPAARASNIIFYGNDGYTLEDKVDQMQAARPIILPDQSRH
jgi:hypothetical protein